MRTKYTDSIKYKVITRLKSIRGNVVLREDLDQLGSYRQISRVLNTLIREKKLVRIGAGIYAKAYRSEYADLALIKGGTDTTLRNALKRLGVLFEAGSAEKEYNAGKTTQVPVRNIVRLKSRCRRRIGHKNGQLIFEKNINAK